MIKTGVSYILNRDLELADRDLTAIAGCCDFVVHTFSETDMYYHRKQAQAIAALSRRKGLDVYLDPWGVGGVFGGETFSRFVAEHPESCLRNKGGRIPVAALGDRQFRKFFKDWLDLAAENKPDVIFWDEPHQGGLRYCKKDCQTIISFLSEMTERAKSRGFKNAVCLYPQEDSYSEELWHRALELESVDIFGTDPYWILLGKKIDFVETFAKKVYNLCNQYGKDPQIWIQAFRIPKGREGEIAQAVKMVVASGIRNIAAWSYDAGSLVTGLESSDGKKVWQTLQKTYKEIKKKTR